MSSGTGVEGLGSSSSGGRDAMACSIALPSVISVKNAIL